MKKRRSGVHGTQIAAHARTATPHDPRRRQEHRRGRRRHGAVRTRDRAPDRLCGGHALTTSSTYLDDIRRASSRGGGGRYSSSSTPGWPALSTGRAESDAIRRFAVAYAEFAYEHARLWHLIQAHQPAGGHIGPDSYLEKIFAPMARLERALVKITNERDVEAASRTARVLWSAISRHRPGRNNREVRRTSSRDNQSSGRGAGRQFPCRPPGRRSAVEDDSDEALRRRAPRRRAG